MGETVRRVMNVQKTMTTVLDSMRRLIEAASPTCRNDAERIAFAVHAFFVVYCSFVLIATGPDAHTVTALSNTSNDEVAIDGWNKQEDEYSFVYKNPSKNWEKVLISCLVMNNKLLIDALSDESSEPAHLAINVGDYAGDDGTSSYSHHVKNLDKLVESLDQNILSKLHGSANASSSSNPQGSETTDRTQPEM